MPCSATVALLLMPQAVVRNLAARFDELLGPDSRLVVDAAWVDARLLHSLLLRLAADSGGVGLLQRAHLLLPLFKVRGIVSPIVCCVLCVVVAEGWGGG